MYCMRLAGSVPSVISTAPEFALFVLAMLRVLPSNFSWVCLVWLAVWFRRIEGVSMKMLSTTSKELLFVSRKT